MTIETLAPQTSIKTTRFLLRPLRASDKGLIELYAGDARVATSTTSIPHPLPPGAAEAMIQRAWDEKRSEDIWAIDGLDVGLSEVTGLISLNRMDRRQSEIGYWVAPAFWNKGIASETIAAVLDDNPQEADTVFAEVFQDNPASARVLTNLGFGYLGDAEAFSVARDHKVPTWTYIKKLAD